MLHRCHHDHLTLSASPPPPPPPPPPTIIQTFKRVECHPFHIDQASPVVYVYYKSSRTTKKKIHVAHNAEHVMLVQAHL
ncbi:hypothetical protein K504DRAFT_264715 [Pleomassaria siparia CBS 279.74]|uniref:Uncharacterized protein n=1 Tax=Pleomassaria siparia CBS 279.74 TaxID=1314801 RepID=A0A6G1KD16_9PLEO|nr:hypothetical protein K504DRAFT_264715 [Pleomassaria siparia CBS 279.74]